MFIYLIVNRITGKYYVGQHKGLDLKRYFQKKFSQARNNRGSSHLFNSMRKHPLPCDWSIHALLSDVQTKPELDQYEKDFIAFLRSQDPEYGYNICRGGEGFTGTFSAESRAKMSIAQKRIWSDPELRKSHDVAMELRRGIPRPTNVRNAISAARFGYKHSSEAVDKIRANRLAQPDPRLGTHHTEEAKKRMSLAKMGSPGTFRGKHHTDEAKEKNRQAHLLDLRGYQFGNVIPVSVMGSSSSKVNWLVRCVVCGVEDTVRSDRVRNGESHFMKVHRLCFDTQNQTTASI